MIEDQTIQLLESYLDEQLDAAEIGALEARLNTEPALRRELQELRSQRTMRLGFFESLEGDDALVDRVLSAIRREATRSVAMGAPRVLRWAVAAAACLLAGFLAGWLLHGSNARRMAQDNLRNRAPAMHVGGVAPTVYKVAITDEYGNVIDVQKFDSLERARQFAEDLDRWQDRLDQLRTGQLTVRSASF